MTHPLDLLIFTDVDGTLLDHRTYSFSAAADSLALLARQGVPLILCSSKTRAELEVLSLALGLDHPFISENGGGLFVPDGYFPFAVRGSRQVGRYSAIEFGLPYFEIVRRLRASAAAAGVRVAGFHDLGDEEVARLCALPIGAARLARQREYDEAFLVRDPHPAAARRRLFAALEADGLSCTVGGRFDHVSGPTSKAHGLAVLRMLYRRAGRRRIVTVGLGDGLNDLELLRAVDIPVVVRNDDGRENAELRRSLPFSRQTTACGASGWNEAVGHLLRTTLP
jgi:mannosyl-3-phosphoglycerate phosphatase